MTITLESISKLLERGFIDAYDDPCQVKASIDAAIRERDRLRGDVSGMTEALRNLCAEMASVAKERGVSRDQVNTYRWCKRRIMAIVADHLTKTHPQPAQDAKDAKDARRWQQLCLRIDEDSLPEETIIDWIDDALNLGSGALNQCVDDDIAAMAKESGQ